VTAFWNKAACLQTDLKHGSSLASEIGFKIRKSRNSTIRYFAYHELEPFGFIYIFKLDPAYLACWIIYCEVWQLLLFVSFVKNWWWSLWVFFILYDPIQVRGGEKKLFLSLLWRWTSKGIQEHDSCDSDRNVLFFFFFLLKSFWFLQYWREIISWNSITLLSMNLIFFFLSREKAARPWNWYSIYGPNLHTCILSRFKRPACRH